MSKFVVVGVIRCVIEADSASEAEETLNEYLEGADIEEGVDWEEITISDAEEVDE